MPPPLPHHPFQVRPHPLLPSLIQPLQLPLHRSHTVVDRENKHHLPPSRLREQQRRAAVHLPLARCVRARVVGCQGCGGEEVEGEDSAAGLQVGAAAVDGSVELVDEGEGGCGGEEEEGHDPEGEGGCYAFFGGVGV